MKVKQKISLYLVRKIRKWLGLSDVFMGVDVGIKDESCIIVVSKLKGGQIRIEDVRFGNYQELRAFIKLTQYRYGIQNRDIVCDMPVGLQSLI